MPSEFEKYLVPFCKRRKNQSFRSYGVGLHQINITSGVLEFQITFNKIESRIIWEWKLINDLCVRNGDTKCLQKVFAAVRTLKEEISFLKSFAATRNQLINPSVNRLSRKSMNDDRM